MSASVNHNDQKAHNELVLSFLSVRRCVGAIGFFLPTVLFLYAMATGEGLRASISGYYFSPMREVFVGTLMALAVFLWSYEGFREPERLLTDRLVARIAAIAVALVALSPTSPDEGASKAEASAQAMLPAQDTWACLLAQVPTAAHPAVDRTLLQCVMPAWGPYIHAGAAVVFFAALAVYCLVLFVRGNADTAEKQAEHRIYRICGWLIVGSIGLLAVLHLTGLDMVLKGLRPIFWLETVACFAFATSWAVKGESLRPVVRMMQPGSP